MNGNYVGSKGELNFEADIVKELTTVGWSLLKPKSTNLTEKDLIENWRNIIFENNIGKLNNIPLSDTEMNQIVEYVQFNCNTPVKANIFLNGKNVCIKRDIDSIDTIHAGKEIYLDIFDPTEIAGGRTRYQIITQTIFKTDKQYNDRRGDITLLINGMPLIHIELKASGVPVSEATNQIQKYAKEGVFTGIFSLIQVFFAISPEDCVYFANPGDYIKYNDTFFFHWADFTNNRITDWRKLIKGDSHILSIPEAHQLVGYYVVADKGRDVLRVARSYQYHAIKQILQRTKHQIWGNHTPLAGYVWATTGSGKTLTSFKAGQLIIDKGFADKVVFVVDRIELNTQTLDEYKSFTRDGEDVQGTSNTTQLFNKLKSTDKSNSLIVTSIQKLNRINDDAAHLKKNELDYIRSRRIVFIVDEAQRSQFGTMHERMKATFPTAIFFGFSGTPIFSENEKSGNTTEAVFGKCLSVYSIACGIRDGNVLGFSPEYVKTYKDADLKEAVALEATNTHSKKEALEKEDSKKTYLRLTKHTPMCSYYDNDGNKQKGIEDYLPSGQYNRPEHRNAVVDDILNNWNVLSSGEKGTRFHAILSTTSITEAIEYYRLFKSKSDLNVTALFDPNIDNSGDTALTKEDALEEIISDYNKRYGQTFDRNSDPGYKKFKTDIINRLSHKKAYKNIAQTPDQCIDILIVVDQLLTGFDSQWLNTLYLDRVLETDKLIQAISRTNRVFDKEEKPFGIVRFYRKPYTMKEQLKEALKLYCEGDTSGVVVADLETNIQAINNTFNKIKEIYDNDGIKDFVQLPKSDESRQKFKKEFVELKIRINSAKLQGLKWDNEYGAKLNVDEKIFKILKMRNDDMSTSKSGSSGGRKSTPGFNIVTHISEMEGEKIDDDYLEANFRKIIPYILTDDDMQFEQTVASFEKELARLSEKDQKFAKQILRDIKDKALAVEEGKTLAIYIAEYREKEENQILKSFADKFGLDLEMLKKTIKQIVTTKDFDDNISTLLDTADKNKTMAVYQSGWLKARGELRKELKSMILGNEVDS